MIFNANRTLPHFFLETLVFDHFLSIEYLIDIRFVLFIQRNHLDDIQKARYRKSTVIYRRNSTLKMPTHKTNRV